MKARNAILQGFLVLSLLCANQSVRAQGTMFTYQGQLVDGGVPANGTNYGMVFYLYDAVSNGTQLANVGIVSVSISNGLFTVPLDFGTNFSGADRWLEITVQKNGGGFTTLSPRQKVTPTPYAIFSEGVNASGISGTLPAAAVTGTYSNAVNFNNGANNFSGTFFGEFLGADFIGGDFTGAFIGDGSSLINLNATQLTSGTVPDARLAANVARTSQVWLLNGNAGTSAGANFIGTTDNQPLAIKAGNQRIVLLQPDSGTNVAPTIIAGSPANAVGSGLVGVTISGGGAVTNGVLYAGNLALGDFNTIGGGWGNVTGSTNFNVAQATVSGGASNTASGISSAIGGGAFNLAYNNDAAIAGGFQNRANFRSAVAGGEHNWADGTEVGIGSGFQNSIESNSTVSYIGGGWQNGIHAGDNYSFIGGGYQNNVSNSYSSVVGGFQNRASGEGSAVVSGYNNSADGPVSVIGGGQGNYIEGSADHCVIAGGSGNDITGGGSIFVYCNIGGGNGNAIQANTGFSIIEGGGTNTIQTNVFFANIDGGASNSVLANSSFATIGGGNQNTNGGNNSVIGGGNLNQVTAANAVIAGGNSNTILGGGIFSVIGGGNNNTNLGPFATIPGGNGNLAGASAFAAGSGALAGNVGSFVWADAFGATISSSNNNSVTFRADGGYRLFSNGGATLGVTLAHNGTSWSAISDRNAKKNFAPVDCEEVLDKLAHVPVEKWNYKSEADNDVPNIGPMAQDFKAAFYPGRDDKTISTLEFDGVELAAIQGLNKKLEEKEARIKSLEERLTRLEKMLSETAEK